MTAWRLPAWRASVLASAALAAGCPARPDYIECVDDTNCGLAAGGRCLPNDSTGHRFCAYPDQGCPGGMRWSDYDVEGSISGACVMQNVDVDAGVDAPPAAGWSMAASSSRYDFAYGVAYDPSGNAYVAGSFYGTATIAGQSVTSNGSIDLFVAKLSPQGERLWVKTFGGTGADDAFDVRADATQVVVVGSFRNAVDFGTGVITAAGTGTEGFTLALDPGGTTTWVDHRGGTGGTVFRRVALSTDGIAVMGDYAGGITLPGGDRASRGTTDVVVLRYAPGGTLGWAHVLSSTGTDNVGGLALVPGGDVIVGMQFSETLDTGVTSPLMSAGGGDLAVARLAGATGAALWARRHGGVGTENLASLDRNDAVIWLAGEFNGATALGTTTATSTGMGDAFVAALDQGGAVAWARTYGAGGWDAAYAVAATPTSAVVAGHFNDSVTIEGAVLHSLGSNDIWLAELSNAGAGLSAKRAGSVNGSDMARALAVRPGWIVVAGDTRGSPDMFGIPLPPLDLFQDGFAVQLTR